MEKKLTEDRAMGFCQNGCQVGCVMGRGSGSKILFCVDENHQACPYLGLEECTAGLWLRGIIQARQKGVSSQIVSEVSVEHRDKLVVIVREVMEQCPSCRSTARQLSELGLLKNIEASPA